MNFLINSVNKYQCYLSRNIIRGSSNWLDSYWLFFEGIDCFHLFTSLSLSFSATWAETAAGYNFFITESEIQEKEIPKLFLKLKNTVIFHFINDRRLSLRFTDSDLKGSRECLEKQNCRNQIHLWITCVLKNSPFGDTDRILADTDIISLAIHDDTTRYTDKQ